MFNQDTRVEVREKLLILYTYNAINLPVPSSHVNDIILKLELMEYFALQQHTIDLTEKGMLEINEVDGESLLMLTEQGQNTLNFFKDRLSTQHTQKIDDIAFEVKKALKRARLIRADYTKLDEINYIVDLSIKDGATDLIKIVINVPTNKRAKIMCDKWREDATKLYHDVIKLFEDESEEI
jgi:DNA-binding transcriptional ArsR family regulator